MFIVELTRLISIIVMSKPTQTKGIGYLKIYVTGLDRVIPHFEGISMLNAMMKSEWRYLNLLSDYGRRTVENISSNT